jgi:tetratricopeptide (TPR) repeat protein
MNRILLGILGAALAGQVAVAAEDAAPSPPVTEIEVLDEAHFLAAAAEAAQRGDKDGAVQLYQSAIIYAPNDPRPYERLASFYADIGQTELAMQFFNAALDVQPAYAPALQGLALLALATGNRAGAEAQRDILRRACGANCPETAQVERALNEAAGAAAPARP